MCLFCIYSISELIRLSCEFGANVLESGKIAVSARNFNEIINSLPGSIIHFIVDEEILKIHCEQSRFNLLCAESSQFPLIPQRDLSNILEIDAEMFKKMVKNTSFAVSSESNRPIFTGILWKLFPEEQLMIATDGKKMAEFTYKKNIIIQQEIEQIVPTKGLLFLDKVINDNIEKVAVN